MVHFSLHPHYRLTVLLKVFSVVYLGHFFKAPLSLLFARIKSAGRVLHGQERRKVKRKREKNQATMSLANEDLVEPLLCCSLKKKSA